MYNNGILILDTQSAYGVVSTTYVTAVPRLLTPSYKGLRLVKAKGRISRVRGIVLDFRLIKKRKAEYPKYEEGIKRLY